MEEADCLPETFCIRDGETFKVFENIIEKTLTVVNVLIPVENLHPATLVLAETPHQKIKATFVRKWNGTHSRSCHWKLAGPFLTTDLTPSGIPVVEFIDPVENLLPFHSRGVRPFRISALV
jgi:hypothetical protein